MPSDQERITALENALTQLLASDRYTFQKHIQIFENRNIQLGSETGTKIGTTILQRLGFFGATPVIRQAAVTPPSGGAVVDSQARQAVNDLITRLQSYGFLP